MKTYLSQRGYAIDKNDTNKDILDTLRADLLVKPFVNPNSMGAENIQEFPVYFESESKFYMPKCFGLKRFGIPKINKMHIGENRPLLKFNGSMRPEQEEPVKAFIVASEDPIRMGGILSLPCGAGKCLAKDTPILMFNGGIKKVQDIRLGDLIMGDDSNPRTINTICQGMEEMVKIYPMKGTPYIVNKSHILSLFDTYTNKFIDMPVLEYSNLILTEQLRYLGYHIAVEFPFREITCPPIKFENTIPFIYKFSHSSMRNTVLHLFIKSSIETKYGYEIKNDSITLLEDIIFIARSLGYHAYTIDRHCIFIEKTPKTIQCVPISIEWLPEDNYYGFEIDGNRRFVLGDCTVTHNTVIALNLASVFKKKTLIICHKEFLMNQWRERITQYLPEAQVGLIKQSKVQVDNKDIVIASLQSLAMRHYDESVFKPFGFVVLDECHHCGAEVFSRALARINSPITLGLSATVKRGDGLSKVFEWHIGKPVFTVKKRSDASVCIIIKRYYDPHPDYGREKVMWNKKINTPAMITTITQFEPRNKVLLDNWEALLKEEPNRKTLVLSDRREHLTTLEQRFKERFSGTVGYYVGGMSEKELKKSETCDVILATYAMASEGMDIPILDTLLLASPVSSIEQPVGRIQRQKSTDRKHVPTVIDLLDDFSIFKGQGNRRIAFYRKQGYTIQDIYEPKEEAPKDDKKIKFRDDDA